MTGPANRTHCQQETPADQICARRTPKREAPVGARMVKIDTAPATAETPKYDGDASEKVLFYLIDWMGGK